MIWYSLSEDIMGYGGKDVTLEVFESYLKKLLHVIDKLPNLDKEKAVMILRNSTDRYWRMLHADYFPAPQAVSHGQDSVNNFPAPGSLMDSSPFSPLAVPGSVESPIKAHTKLESEAILAEITDLAGSQHLTCLTGDENTAGSESWDRHLENTNTQLQVFTQSQVSHTVSPRCALCSKLFSSTKEVTDHYQPVSCIGCKKELCNKDIFAIHYSACKDVKHYQAKVKTSISTRSPRTNPATAEISECNSEKNLNLDEKKSSGKKQTYKCHECAKTFVTAFQLNKHIKGHNDNNCDKCDAKFAKRKQLVNHLKTVHYISTAENYYLCNFCPRKFVKRPSLWAHYSEHTVGEQVVCLKCGQILEDAEMMARHTQEHQTSARHTCEKCGEFFARKQQYLAHIVGHEKYRCKLCGKDFSSKKKLKLHKNVEHDSNNTIPSKSKLDNIIATANRDYTCLFCLQNYKNKTLLNAHDCPKNAKKNEKNPTIPKDVSVKLSSSKYKCRFCEFEHKKSSAVVRHARIHRNKKRFVCEQCGTAFSAHYTLKEHRIYVHSEDRKFPCDKCDKTFKARNALIRHEKQVHSDAREHVCHCGQMFKRATHLKRHVATSHKGETLVPAVTTEPMPAVDKAWAEAGDTAHEASKFKSSWDSSNKFGIPASVALDVVTSLDLNVRMIEHRQLEAKEKGLGKGETEKPLVAPISEPEPDHRVERESREASHSGYNGHSDYSRLGYSQTGHSRYHAHPGSQTERFLGPSSLLESSSHSRYYPASLPRQDKDFDIHSEKLYLQQQGVGPQDKMYLSTSIPTSNPGIDRNYSIDDRGYSHSLVSRNCDDDGSQIPRTSASNLDPLFTDSGPADLTMARSSMSGPSPREAGHYSRHHPSKLRYSNYTSATNSRTASSSSYPSHSYSHRLQEFRPGTSHHSIPGIPLRNIEQVPSGMDSLDDPYRPLAELSYSQRQQGHYMDTSMDNYLPHDREELELSQCDKKKLYKTDKFYRTGEHQDVMNTSHRGEEGVLLPPLLALAPHHQHSHHHPHTPGGGGQAPVSPQNIKLDYLCGSQSDQIASQYIQDGIDYNNII